MIETPVPQKIHRDDREIVITWSAEHVSHYPARRLRLWCHCALCREEMTGKPLLDPDTVPKDVRPERIELVGGYGIRIAWSDGHGTGIYTYRYLKDLCRCERCTGAERQRGGRS